VIITKGPTRLFFAIFRSTGRKFLFGKADVQAYRPYANCPQVEFSLVHINHEEKTVHLNLNTATLLHKLTEEAEKEYVTRREEGKGGQRK
jgi:hypothetical protein